MLFSIRNSFISSRLHTLYLAILLLGAGIALSATQPWPKPAQYVSDFAEVISPKYEQQMNQLAASLKEKTQAEMAIVTIPSFSERGFGSIEEAAVDLFQQWGIGRKGENDGLLILVAIRDRKWRIEVGYGLEGTIPDVTASRLGRTLLPDAFRQSRYGDGLLNLSVALVAEIAREKNIPLDQFNLNAASVPAQSSPNQRGKGGSGIGSLFHLIFGIIFFLVLVSNPRLFLLYMLFGGGGRSRHWGGGSHFGGGFGGGGGGSFGGFGGGISGGGGSSGGW